MATNLPKSASPSTTEPIANFLKIARAHVAEGIPEFDNALIEAEQALIETRAADYGLGYAKGKLSGRSASPSEPQNKRAEAAENDLMRLAKLLPRDGKSHILPIAERVANYIADLKATIAKDSPAVSPGAEVTRIAPHFPTADKSVEYSGEAAEPERDAPDSINYLEIHHTDGRVKVWYGQEARGRFKGIDHDPTTREEWKRMAGEGVRTIEALTTNSGDRQAEREAAMDAIERVIEMADSYKTASQMTLSDARNALKYFRASAAPLSQMPAERLADDAIGLFLEYRDKHGYDEESARASVVREVIDASQPQPSAGQTEGK